MEYALLGFFTGLSLILALGAQNIFVIEQGLKKQYVFLICLICSISDLILIFLGIFLFHYFNQYFNQTIELIFNILLIIFLLHFIYTKIKTHYSDINFHNELIGISKINIILKIDKEGYFSLEEYNGSSKIDQAIPSLKEQLEIAVSLIPQAQPAVKTNVGTFVSTKLNLPIVITAQ